MRALKFLAFASFSLLLLITGCRSDELMPGDALAYIPETATSVTAINLDRLMKKADFDDLKQMEFYQDFLAKVRQENAAFAQVLQDPRLAGIDLKNNVYLSMELDKPGQSGLVTLVFTIEDKDAFEKTLDDLEISYLPANNEPGFFQENSTVLTWNDAVGILGIGQENTVQQRTEAYLVLDEEKSIRSNENLREALSGDFDVMNWISSKGFVELFDLGQVGKMARYTEEDLKENYLQSFLFFEAGEMRAETQYHLQTKLAGDLALVMNNKVKTDFRDKLPHDNLFFYANFGLRPKGINQLLIEYHIKGLSDEPFKPYGFSTEDMIRAFSGDAAIAIYQEKGNNTLNFPSFLGAFSIDSREHLDRILLAGQNADLLHRVDTDRFEWLTRPVSDTLIERSDRVEGYLLIKDDLLYFSDETKHLDQIVAGDFNTGGALPKRMNELTAKNAMAALIDLAWMSQTTDDLSDLPIATVESTSSRKKSGISVKMANQEMNSLKQFFQWMNEKYMEEKANKPERKDNKS